MQANRRTRPRKQLWLRTSAFDELTQHIGALSGKTQQELADMFGINKSTWSSCRTGARPLPVEFIAEAMDLIPGVPIAHYASNRRPEVTE